MLGGSSESRGFFSVCILLLRIDGYLLILFRPLTFLGLSLIAIGTGGIKPCVAAFGGDQFHLPSQQLLLQQFFSVFYFAINLGGFVGMIFTPVLRKGITCFGEDTCYAIGFGFPAILMLIAICKFINILLLPDFLLALALTLVRHFFQCFLRWANLGIA